MLRERFGLSYIFPIAEPEASHRSWSGPDANWHADAAASPTRRMSDASVAAQWYWPVAKI